MMQLEAEIGKWEQKGTKARGLDRVKLRSSALLLVLGVSSSVSSSGTITDDILPLYRYCSTEKETQGGRGRTPAPVSMNLRDRVQAEARRRHLVLTRLTG